MVLAKPEGAFAKVCEFFLLWKLKYRLCFVSVGLIRLSLTTPNVDITILLVLPNQF